jgi:hypothetical protein
VFWVTSLAGQAKPCRPRQRSNRCHGTAAVITWELASKHVRFFLARSTGTAASTFRTYVKLLARRRTCARLIQGRPASSYVDEPWRAITCTCMRHGHGVHLEISICLPPISNVLRLNLWRRGRGSSWEHGRSCGNSSSARSNCVYVHTWSAYVEDRWTDNDVPACLPQPRNDDALLATCAYELTYVSTPKRISDAHMHARIDMDSLDILRVASYKIIYSVATLSYDN